MKEIFRDIYQITIQQLIGVFKSLDSSLDGIVNVIFGKHTLLLTSIKNNWGNIQQSIPESSKANDRKITYLLGANGDVM